MVGVGVIYGRNVLYISLIFVAPPPSYYMTVRVRVGKILDKCIINFSNIYPTPTYVVNMELNYGIENI
jgi:hypothetical protein